MPQIVGETGLEADDEFTPPTVFARDFIEYMTFEETGIKAEELPKPTLWYCLIMPKQPKKMTAGGIALPTQAQDVEMHLNYIGQVVALGPLAGKSDKFQNPEWIGPIGFQSSVPRYLWDIKVGDWVIYGRYAGMHKEFKGVKFITVNDDAITDVIKSPSGFKVYV